MVDEAKRTAAVLGYNYPGNEWYQHSWDQLVRDHDVQRMAQGGRAQDGGAQDGGGAQAGTPPPSADEGFFARAWHSLF